MSGREGLATALAQVGIVNENIGSMGNADQYILDYATTDRLIAALAERGYVLAEARTVTAVPGNAREALIAAWNEGHNAGIGCGHDLAVCRHKDAGVEIDDLAFFDENVRNVAGSGVTAVPPDLAAINNALWGDHPEVRLGSDGRCRFAGRGCADPSREGADAHAPRRATRLRPMGPAEATARVRPRPDRSPRKVRPMTVPDALRALSEAATPGPWRAVGGLSHGRVTNRRLDMRLRENRPDRNTGDTPT